jgi:hypothetical protein
MVSGTCVIACENVGLSQGAPFSGVIGVDEASFVSDWVSAGITFYDFSFGSFAISSGDEAISNNLVEWGSTPNEVRTLNILAYASLDASKPGAYLSLTAGNGKVSLSWAANDAYWADEPDVDPTFQGNGALLSANKIELAPSSVPLPATAILLAAAAGGLWLRRRR